MSTATAIPAWILSDALELALDEVRAARCDEPELSDADLWAYGRRRVDYWIGMRQIREALASDR